MINRVLLQNQDAKAALAEAAKAEQAHPRPLLQEVRARA